MNHPLGSIENILTFLWCIWKNRNDCLFKKKEKNPTQIIQMANAINRNMEMVNVVQESIDRIIAVGKNECKNNAGNLLELEDIDQGETLRTDLMIQGSKIFSDAAWKTKNVPGTQGTVSTGIGVFCHRQNIEEKILIQASASSMAPSPLHAEALGLLLGSQIAMKLKAQKVTFLTDNLTLAKAAAAKTISGKKCHGS
jgi:hypothetical protein